MMPDITTAQEPVSFEAARDLFREYAGELSVDLRFQGFSSELNNLETMYAAPTGWLGMLHHGGEAVGCVGVRRFSASECEMKRLYVRPSARGIGVGRALALAAIHAARDLGYRTMLLDTLSSMTRAQALYRALGFVETAPYYANLLPQVKYLKCVLDGVGEPSCSSSFRV